jgi:hypothetical protein
MELDDEYVTVISARSTKEPREQKERKGKEEMETIEVRVIAGPKTEFVPLRAGWLAPQPSIPVEIGAQQGGNIWHPVWYRDRFQRWNFATEPGWGWKPETHSVDKTYCDKERGSTVW